MDGYISKPVQLEELRNALQELQVFPLSREKSAKAGC
jgi:CheY-like chemotaxis protein